MKIKNSLLLLCMVLSVLPTMGMRSFPEETVLSESIYADALGTGWSSWSWATINLSATSPVHTGSDSIKVNFTAWSGLYLHKGSLDTTGFTKLVFYVHGGGVGGQRFKVYMCGDDGKSFGSYAVTVPAASTWSEISIPLSTLNPDDKTVTGLVWQDSTGGSQSALYLDDIQLGNDESADAPTLSDGVTTPRSIRADGESVLTVKVTVSDPQGISDVSSVTVDASALGRGTISLSDDGNHNDGSAGDGVYGAAFTVATSTGTGEQRLLVSSTDKEGNTSSLRLNVITVLAEPGGSIPSELSQSFGWGTNSWSLTDGDDWQVNSGVPWDYVYQYITWGWESWGTNFTQKFVQQAWNKGYVPVVTVYLMLGVPPNNGEGGSVYAEKLQNSTTVANYLASYKRALEQANGDKPVIFAIEPDFYGFMQQLSNDEDSRPDGVVANDPSSYDVALNISGYDNTLAGFGQYLVDLTHETAPNVLAAPMINMWAEGTDPQSVTDDEAIEVATLSAQFVNAMGGDEADLLTVEWSDRDAGRGIRPWWDDTDSDTPRVNRAVLWENALSAASGKRLLLWQVPVGNMSLDNTDTHYQDNRAAYAFYHSRDLFDAGVIGLVFGGGDGVSTGVDTDGGYVGEEGLVMYAAPAAPQGIELTGSSQIWASLRWDENNEEDLYGYQIIARLNGSSQTQNYFVGRRNSTSILLPYAGTWSVTIRACDAMENYSTESSSVSVTITENANLLHLPLIQIN